MKIDYGKSIASRPVHLERVEYGVGFRSGAGILVYSHGQARCRPKHEQVEPNQRHKGHHKRARPGG
jgi:hypothetical protein